MLSFGNVGQNHYNTNLAYRGNASKLLQQLDKKQIISADKLDQFSYTDPVANAKRQFEKGLISKKELEEVIVRERMGK